MSKNIGFSKKHASCLAKVMNTSECEAYYQKEEHWPSAKTYQWIVVIQKRNSKKKGGGA